MKSRLLSSLVLSLSLVAAGCTATQEPEVRSLYQFDDTAGVSDRDQPLSEFSGKVALVVNITSKCGTTPQLEGLEQLYQTYKSHGFVVLGFPTEDFGSMGLESSSEIVNFCQKQFDVSFPIYPIASVSGLEKQSVYRFLTESSEEQFQGEVTFNFEKILVDRSGKVFGRFGPFTGPMSTRLREAVEEALAKG